jgi:hypothetical protein
MTTNSSPKNIVVLPDKDFFSIEELSVQWGCCSKDIETYVYDHKILRLSVLTEYAPEIQSIKRASCILVNTDIHIKAGTSVYSDLSLLYKDKEPAPEIQRAKEELDLLMEYNEDTAYPNHIEGVTWESPPPRFLYLNFQDGYVERSKNLVPARNLRLTRQDQFYFDTFETFSGDIISICDSSTHKRLGIDVDDVVVSARERDRFVERYSGSKMNATTMNLSEEQKLQLIIGAAARLLANRKGSLRHQSGEVNVNQLIDFMRLSVVKKRGLSRKTLDNHIKTGLELLKTNQSG